MKRLMLGCAAVCGAIFLATFVYSSEKSGAWPGLAGLGTPANAEVSIDDINSITDLLISGEDANYDFDPSLNIDYAEDTQKFMYHVYGETEIFLEGSSGGRITWDITEHSLPPGMALSDSDTDQIYIFGTPEFVDQWCFVLTARVESEQTTTSRQVCIESEDNPNYGHLKYQTGRFLETAEPYQHYDQSIKVESSATSSISGEHYSGWLPEGMKAELQDRRSKFRVSGTPTEEGIYIFGLRVHDDIRGRSVYKQFQLVVSDEDVRDCPAGYYYDDALGYCVQEQLDACPDGTYYEPDTNSCVQYPAPPPNVTCRTGYYYDHYVNRCVRLSYPRCPLNYRWDSFYDQCVREPYTCPIGTRYSWLRKECVFVWNYGCSVGSHYDSYLGRCVRNRHVRCGYGHYWDRRDRICRRSNRRYQCGSGRVWSPREGRCVRRGQRCRGGSHWDYDRRRCVRRPGRHLCGQGYHWSPRLRRCVRNRRPMRPMRPMRPPMRPMRPMRPPMRPMRPMHPPMRPMQPPMRPMRPMQPPMRPMRPMHPPMRPMQPPMRPMRPMHPPMRPMHPPMRPMQPPMRPMRPMHPPMRPMRPMSPPMRPMSPPMRPMRPMSPPMRPMHPPMRPMSPMRPPMRPMSPMRPRRGRASLDLETSMVIQAPAGSGKVFVIQYS